jgi:hypothetical protein
MSTMARKPAGTQPSPLSKKASPGQAQPAADPYSTSTGYQQQPVAMPSYQQPSGNYSSWRAPPKSEPSPAQANSMTAGVPNQGTTAGYWPAGWNGDQVRPDPRDPKTIQQQWLDKVNPGQRPQLEQLFAQNNAAGMAQPAQDPYSYSTSYQPQPVSQPLYGSPMGGFSTQPTTPQRDAFINNINEQMIPYYTGQASGPPQFNIQHAWDQGGQMVQNGWQNPFAQMLGTLQGQSAPPMYQPGPMMPPPMQPQTGFGQAQQGYTDDEIQRLMRDGDPERGIRPMPGVGLMAAGTPKEYVDRRYQEMKDSWMRANNITPQSTGMGQPVTGWGQGISAPPQPAPPPTEPSGQPEPSVWGDLSPEQQDLAERIHAARGGELPGSSDDPVQNRINEATLQQTIAGVKSGTYTEDWLDKRDAAFERKRKFNADRDREEQDRRNAIRESERLLEKLMAAPQAKQGHIIVNKQWVPTTPANVQRYYNEGPGLELSNAQKNLMESRIKWSHPAYQGYGF